ncbi:hypothetical protein [Mycobacterium vicinigordonae]|uniref:Serine/threonine protein kinase n=1 Tax=Mycobacterium vicinigordonae TaxID=1719132 RepID=A0A7D6I4P2_9MYCO|nr:hypothetical protein [Mycobacterium vicinigordonae]QLL05736.1 hypothetical protein H0P51_18155 [Mycobacterium vicinigordonae]
MRFAGSAVAVVALAGVVSGCLGGGAKSARPTVTPHDTATSRLAPIYPGTTVSIPPPGSGITTPSSPSSSTSSTATPHTFPGDGTFKVGSEIQPGTYRSLGGHSCYWERLRGLSGNFADIIANGAGDWPQVVQIAPTDLAFKTQGCPTWSPQSATTTPSTTTTTSRAPVTLPPGAQACPATSGPAGGFASSAVGSSDTTCPFAEQVRLAYGAGGPASVTPRQVDAVSPVTGQHYTMTCAANGSLVVCNGGTGAIVYVY